MVTDYDNCCAYGDTMNKVRVFPPYRYDKVRGELTFDSTASQISLERFLEDSLK